MTATLRRTLALEGASHDVVDVVVHTCDAVTSGLAVVLAHGAGGNLDDVGLVALADVVATAGHRTVRVNLPYRQRRASGPPPRAARSVDDWAAVLAAVVGLGTSDDRWVIGGKSYGGRVATMLAARGADVAGVLCHSYPLHPPGSPDKLRVDHFPDITVPTLFLQGTDDPFGDPGELAPHVNTLGAPGTVVAVPGGDHSLHVPRTRSADGATHRPPEVIAGLGPPIIDWLGGLVPGATPDDDPA